MNLKKMATNIGLITVLMFAFVFALPQAAYAGEVWGEEDKPDFNMYVDSSVITPGKESTVTVTFNNITNYNAFYAYALLTANEDNTKLFGDEGGNYISKDVGSLGRNGNTSTKFTFTPSTDLKAGSYNMTVTLVYKNRQGSVSKKEFPLVLTVDSGTPVDLTVPESSVEGGRAKYGEPFTLNVKLSNNGQTIARDVRVTLKNLSADKIFQTGTYDSPTMQAVKGFEVVPLTFYLMASEDIATGYYPIELEVSYKDKGEERITKTLTVYVDVEGSPDKEDEDDKISVPRVILDNYVLNPSTVNMGESFTFSFTIKNTSTERTVKNLQVSLTSSEGTVMPASGSNSFYVAELGPEQSTTLNLQMTTKYDVEKTTYPLTLNFNYEDAKANPYTSDVNLTIPVFLPTKLTLQNQNYPESGMVNQGNYLSFEYINKGKGTIYNLTVSVEGNIQTDIGSSSYIGNVDSGYSDSMEIMVTPLEAGVQNCKLILTYEDAAGNQLRTEEPFVMAVEEELPMEDPGMMDPGMVEMPPEEGGMPGWLLPLGGVIVLIAAATAFVVVRKKQKAKKLAEEEALFASENE